MMKVLIADPIAAEGIDYLRSKPDLTVVEAYKTSSQNLLEKVKDVHAIIVRSETKITAEVIAAAPLLKAVGRAGVGIDNVDVKAATAQGVIVMNAPSGNTIATTELTFTHMLCAARQVVQSCANMKSGGWDRKKFTGSELFKKTIGIIGLGRIGTELAQRAKAFEMNVLAYDPYLTEERAQKLQIEKTNLNSLCKRADYITIHVPKTQETKNLINAQTISLMKEGVCILNCARGGLINETDLVQAIENGKVRAVGLDVYESEPLEEAHPLRKLPQAVLTPHLGASTKEAQISVGVEIAESIYSVLHNGPARNGINMPAVDPDALKILHPYLNLGERLGSMIQQMAPETIEKIKITYWGQIVDLDTLPLTRSIQRGYLRKINDEGINDVNAPHILKNLGIDIEVTESSEESDYNELIKVEAFVGEKESYSLKGTLIGKNNQPRIVGINNREIEITPEGVLLVLESQDKPGMVGIVGNILGKDNTNIASMALGRNGLGNWALSIFQLDNIPTPDAIKAIATIDGIKSVRKIAL